MNIKSLLITIVVAFITVFVTDGLIHGLWLKSTYAATASLWRPEMEMLHGWMVIGQFLVAASFTMIFAACVAERRCISCSLKYAACMGIFAGGGQVIMYGVQPYPGLLVAKWFFIGIVQTLVLGFVVHKVYKLPAK